MGVPERDIDQGWALMIFLAGFLNFFLSSILYVSGVFNVMFMEQYGGSVSMTSWAGALAIGLYSLAAPLGSLCNVYLGPRYSIYIGGALASLGYILTYFASSLVQVIITFGIMQGVGIAIIYYSSLVSIGFYFRKYRNLAYGFALTGIGFGIMVFPVLLEFLTETYGQKGTLLIVGAIQMHIFVAGTLTRPYADKTSQKAHHSVVDSKENTDCKNLRDSGSQGNYNRAINGNYVNNNMGNSTDSHTGNGCHGNNGYHLVGKHNDKTERMINQDDANMDVYKDNHENLVWVKSDKESLTNKNGLSPVKSFTVDNNDNDNTDDILCEIPDTTICEKLHLEANLSYVWASIKEYLTVPLVIYCISLFLNGLSLYSTYVHFPGYTKSMGVTSQRTSVLLAVMGAGSLICRVVVGIATNGSRSRTMICYILCGVLCGVTCLAGPYLCVSTVGQVTFSLCFSFFGNVCIALFSPLLIDLMGLDKSVVTTGVCLTMIGLSSTGGPPLEGAIVDYTGSYYYIFIINGVCCLVGNLIMILIPMWNRLKDTKKFPDLDP